MISDAILEVASGLLNILSDFSLFNLIFYISVYYKQP